MSDKPGVGRLYRDLMVRHPLAMNGAQAGLLSALSNATSQVLRGAWDPAAGGAGLDPLPIRNFALVAAVVMTPVSTWWFGTLGKLKLGTMPQLALDTVVGSVFMNACFVIALSILEV